jgi:DNA (cytosine-5)-methyltransferase 3A
MTKRIDAFFDGAEDISDNTVRFDSDGINVLSLFDGISCGQIALERAGIKVKQYYASEINKHAIIVTQRNYPNTIQLGSVVDVNPEDLPKIDLLIGGSPCQSFSMLGKRHGMSTVSKQNILTLDDYLDFKGQGYEFQGQSYLFWEYVRLLRSLNPRYFLLENVLMLKQWEKVITHALDVVPIFINSNLVSAQDRKRLYWTNIPFNPNIKDKNIVATDIKDGDDGYIRPAQMSYISKEIVEGITKYTKYARYIDGKFPCITTSCGSPWPLGSSIWIRDKEFIFERPFPTNDVKPLTVKEAERLQTLPDDYTAGIAKTHRYAAIGNGWTVDVIAHIFKSLQAYKFQ